MYTGYSIAKLLCKMSRIKRFMLQQCLFAPHQCCITSFFLQLMQCHVRKNSHALLNLARSESVYMAQPDSSA